MPDVPNTRATVEYAYTIKANGKKVGTLQRFNPTSTRAVQRLRGIQNTGGRVIEIVPGTTDTSITLDKVTLHRESLIAALGYDVSVKDIQDIRDPIDIEEVEHHPDGTRTTRVFGQCVPSQWSKTIAVGTVFVTESVTVQVSHIR